MSTPRRPQPIRPATEPVSPPELDAPDTEVWRLLPWLTNDTLEREELDRVLDHLKTSAACRRELAFLSDLARIVEVASVQDATAHQDRLDRVMTRIDAYEQARKIREDREASLGTKVERQAIRNARPWITALAAGLLLVVGLLYWRAGMHGTSASEPRRPEFQTLSSPASDQATVDGPALRLIFAPDVREDQMRPLLLDAGLEIVAGPSPLGVYTVAPTSGEAAAGLDPLVSRLRTDPKIALVEEQR